MKPTKASYIYSAIFGFVLGVVVTVPLVNHYGYWSLAWLGLVASFIAIMLLTWRDGKGEGYSNSKYDSIRFKFELDEHKPE